MKTIQCLYGVYAIRCLINGKRYVGSTYKGGTLRRRLQQHRSDLRAGRARNSRLRDDLERYGPAAFVIEVLEPCETPAEALEREKYWVNQFQSVDPCCGYNVQIPTAVSEPKTVQGRRTKSRKLSKRACDPEVRARIAEGVRRFWKDRRHRQLTKEHGIYWFRHADPLSPVA